jgi:DNA-binding NarL/FixJ family response regulator
VTESAFRTAIHALDLDEPAWINALFAEGRSLFDEGQGLFVYSYRVGARPVVRLGALAGDHTAPGVWQMLSRWGSENAKVLARSYVTGAGGVEARAADSSAPVRELLVRLESQGIADLFTILAHDPRGFGVFLTAPQHRERSLNPARRRFLERLAAELGASLRLRQARRKVDLGRLSASESTVMRMLASGASDKQIALALGVGLSTVSTFARRARTKLGCPPGSEALLTAQSSSERSRRDLFARLTASECDVAADLLLGRSHAEIALKRGSSARTVAAQCSLIFRKCGVTGRRSLAAAMLSLSGTSGK